MDSSQVQEMLLREHGIRVGPQMSDYVRRQMLEMGNRPRPLFVIGGDARTGMPLRQEVLLVPPSAPNAAQGELFS